MKDQRINANLNLLKSIFFLEVIIEISDLEWIFFTTKHKPKKEKKDGNSNKNNNKFLSREEKISNPFEEVFISFGKKKNIGIWPIIEKIKTIKDPRI